VFQETDAYFNLGRTRVVYKTQRLSAAEKEDAIYRIKPNILSLEKIRDQCDDVNTVQ
jgi:hypothetical protein